MQSAEFIITNKTSATTTVDKKVITVGDATFSDPGSDSVESAQSVNFKVWVLIYKLQLGR